MADYRQSFSALNIIKKIISDHVQPGELCVDATAGRGNDTLFLRQLVGESGKVYAFDIQEEAVESTKALLEKHDCTQGVEVLLKSHSEMEELIAPGTVSCMTFNFGWLPKGDHNIHTQKETSIQAIESGLKLLKNGGIMTLILYYGRETGFEERDALLEYLPTIDNKHYTVVEMPFVNRTNCPPIPVVIYKDL